MIMCVLLCYPVSIHMLQLLSTGRPISSIHPVISSFCFVLLYRFPLYEGNQTWYEFV